MKKMTAFFIAILFAVTACGCAPKVFRANYYSTTKGDYLKIISVFKEAKSPFDLKSGEYRIVGDIALVNGINVVNYSSDVTYNAKTVSVNGNVSVARKTPISILNETLKYYDEENQTYIEKNGESKPFIVSSDNSLYDLGCPDEVIDFLQRLFNNLELIPADDVEVAKRSGIIYLRIKVNEVSFKSAMNNSLEYATAVGDIYLTFDQRISQFIGVKLAFKSYADENSLSNSDIIVGNVGLFTKLDANFSFYKI